MRVCDNMVSRFWPEMEFQMHWCSFDQLATSNIASAAARQAALANIIIIASGSNAGLPDTVKAWMDDWCNQRHGREGSLIALLEGSPQNQEFALADQNLRNIAHRAGLDYLTHEPDFAPVPLPKPKSKPKAAASKRRALALAEAVSLPCTSPTPNWTTSPKRTSLPKRIHLPSTK